MQFADWRQPGAFYGAVRRSLAVDEQPYFEAIWQESIKAEHWNSPNLVECSTNAENALARTFPDLHPSAVNAVARAAAYEWR